MRPSSGSCYKLCVKKPDSSGRSSESWKGIRILASAAKRLSVKCQFDPSQLTTNASQDDVLLKCMAPSDSPPRLRIVGV